MKPQFVSNHVLKAISVSAIVTGLLIANPFSTHAAGPVKEKKISTISENQVSVQYSGSDENSFVFRVQFENPSAQKFSLMILNDEGVVVFEKEFSDIHFAKNVRLPKESGDIHPTFIIRAGKREVKRSFSVNRITTENIEVTKL